MTATKREKNEPSKDDTKENYVTKIKIYPVTSSSAFHRPLPRLRGADSRTVSVINISSERCGGGLRRGRVVGGGGGGRLARDASALPRLRCVCYRENL
jgi:hypothetical protein